ncbi:Serine/threonine-protein kinase PK-1 [Enhygromyxa salina]|uniref:Serine/threonine-protein kinase PK-1 n=1 Tax=Enhygromyxa salina TaxID=215803 RepID=A0A2S9YEC8_9BACT|nr:serine/threonine-protein kinase [Enhygromyxa salina]PRQ03455.1 Serine/threonine-protein kinase PK-1 [Enhygromyxa salina]
MAGDSPHPGHDTSTQVDAEPEEPDDGSPSRPDWLTRGQTIGRYRVIECLGVGGMGVIYSAWDPELDRKLAIKIVRGRDGSLGSPRGRARLLREGQALARLRHPNVISVHDVGTHEGRVFVAMEFIEGQTLHQWLQRSPRPPTAELVDVFLQIGRGLAAAHRAGLVHRDVKPENVMIGEDDRVMVLDFGIAREGYISQDDLDDDLDDGFEDDLDEDDPAGGAPALTDQPTRVESASGLLEPGVPPRELLDDHTPLAELTRLGAVVGTPAYMSPEQHRGRPVDVRGDQFSYCVAMWEALNGEKPYGEGSREKLLARMRLGQLKPFRKRDVPRRVVRALRRGLAWNPAQRHPSMEALLEALNPRGRAAEQRLWFGLALGSLAGAVIGVAATVMSLGPSPSPEPERPASPDELGVELAKPWTHGPAAPREAVVRVELASALEARGDFEAALVEYERALALFEQAHGQGRRSAEIRARISELVARGRRGPEPGARK